MNPYNRAPMYAGGMNVPGAPGNLGSYASLPLDEAVQQIERQEEDYQRKKFEYDMNPDNQPQPYNPETNPVFPDYPFGRPTGTGGFATLPYYGGPTNPMQMPYYAGQDYGGVEQLAGGFRPGAYGEIRGGQSPYRFGPYLPYRGEEKKEEQTPFIPLPVQQAQGLPMGFQNKYVS